MIMTVSNTRCSRVLLGLIKYRIPNWEFHNRFLIGETYFTKNKPLFLDSTYEFN